MSKREDILFLSYGLTKRVDVTLNNEETRVFLGGAVFSVLYYICKRATTHGYSSVYCRELETVWISCVLVAVPTFVALPHC